MKRRERRRGEEKTPRRKWRGGIFRHPMYISWNRHVNDLFCMTCSPSIPFLPLALNATGREVPFGRLCGSDPVSLSAMEALLPAEWREDSALRSLRVAAARFAKCTLFFSFLHRDPEAGSSVREGRKSRSGGTLLSMSVYESGSRVGVEKLVGGILFGSAAGVAEEAGFEVVSFLPSERLVFKGVDVSGVRTAGPGSCTAGFISTFWSAGDDRVASRDDSGCKLCSISDMSVDFGSRLEPVPDA